MHVCKYAVMNWQQQVAMQWRTQRRERGICKVISLFNSLFYLLNNMPHESPRREGTHSLSMLTTQQLGISCVNIQQYFVMHFHMQMTLTELLLSLKCFKAMFLFYTEHFVQ